MSKKVGIVLAVVGAILLLCCLGGIFFTKSVTAKIFESVDKDKAFVATALNATAKTWDEEAFATFADESFNTPTRREETRKLFATLKQKLGPMLSLEEVIDDKKSFKADNSGTTQGFFVTLHANAKFQKGTGVFTVTVKNLKDQIKITDIHLDPLPGAKSESKTP